MLLRAVVALLAWLAIAPVAHAIECVPLRSFIARLESEKGFVHHEILDNERGSIVLRLFNNLPPKSDYKWPLVVTASFSDGTGRIFVGENDSICASMPVHPLIWQMLREMISGKSI